MMIWQTQAGPAVIVSLLASTMGFGKGCILSERRRRPPVSESHCAYVIETERIDLLQRPIFTFAWRIVKLWASLLRLANAVAIAHGLCHMHCTMCESMHISETDHATDCLLVGDICSRHFRPFAESQGAIAFSLGIPARILILLVADACLCFYSQKSRKSVLASSRL